MDKMGFIQTFFPLLLAGLTTAGFAQIYKCVGVSGQVEFSNLACPKNSTVSIASVKTNVLDTSGMRVQAQLELMRNEQEQRTSETLGMVASSRTVGPTSECLKSSEIGNLETSATSITKGKKEKRFLEDEARRARQCERGQGNYQREDLVILRDAAAAQSNLRPEDRETARRRAESVHIGANPAEAVRIMDARAAEKARLEQQRNQAAMQAEVARAADAAGVASLDNRRTIQSCIGTRCISTDGTRLTRDLLTGRMTDDKGLRCTRLAGTNRVDCW